MKSAILALAFLVSASFCTAANGQKNIVETAAGAGSFNTLLTAAKAAGLADALSSGQFTVFAPTDEAFGKLDPEHVADLLKPQNKEQLAAILKFHVVPGIVSAREAYPLDSATTLNGQRLPLSLRSDKPSVGNANLVKADIRCSNGVIHVIDSVLLPATKTIPEVADSAGTFKTLLAAATAAGLAETLGTAGPFTVFAPTDEAFGKLPASTVETLLKPENKQKLADILKYHVVSGRAYDVDAAKAGQVATLLGRSLSFDVTENGLTVNNVNVVAKNIETANGVVHVIDAVLLPPQTEQMNPQATIGLIETAIKDGSAVFNSGDHQRCAQIYMATLERISQSSGAKADVQTMGLINSTLQSVTTMHGDTDKAWALRGCMDQVYARMQTLSR